MASNLRISLPHPAHQVSSNEAAWHIAVRLWSYPVDALRPFVDWIASRELGRPTRVGLDGPSAAGKTTVADALAELVQSITNRPVIRASIDDFHRPGHKFRSMRGEWTTQSYYDESYDYLAFRDLVLRPLGAGGNRRLRTAIFGSFHDLPIPEQWQVASENTILIVDGAFLQREELRSDWDYLLWLKLDAETIISRARQRDVAWVGSAAVVEHRYRKRMLPAHSLYESLVDPEAHADAVIDTTDLNAPRLEQLGHAPVLSDGVVIVDCLSLADAYTHWVGEDDELARRFGWYPRRSTLNGVRAFILEGQRQWREGGPRRTLAIRMADTRTLVGGCETRLQPDRSAEVSWWIFPDYRHRGFASRAVRLMTRWMAQAFRVRRCVAFMEPDNVASRGVAQNVGFVELDMDVAGERPILRHELAMAPTLYALCGLPFAGKSTIATKLASEVGAPIVRLDAINTERGLGLNAEPIPTDEWDRTYAEAYRRLHQTLAAGSSVIFDHVNFTRRERDRLRQIAAKQGARLQIVYVPVTVDEARRRLLASRETGDRYDIRDDDFEHVVTHFEPPDDEPDVIRRQARQ